MRTGAVVCEHQPRNDHRGGEGKAADSDRVMSQHQVNSLPSTKSASSGVLARSFLWNSMDAWDRQHIVTVNLKDLKPSRSLARIREEGKKLVPRGLREGAQGVIRFIGQKVGQRRAVWWTPSSPRRRSPWDDWEFRERREEEGKVTRESQRSYMRVQSGPSMLRKLRHVEADGPKKSGW